MFHLVPNVRMAHLIIVANALRDIIYLAQPVKYVLLAVLLALPAPLTVHHANPGIY